MADERENKWKREKGEYFNTLKMYPRYADANLPIFVGCAIAANKESTKKAFERVCPKFFSVDNVECFTRNKDPVCYWMVDYVHKQELPGAGPDLKVLVDAIVSKVPVNCYVIDRGLKEKEKIKIFYAVHCKCIPPIFEESATRSSLFSSIGQSIITKLEILATGTGLPFLVQLYFSSTFESRNYASTFQINSSTKFSTEFYDSILINKHIPRF